jgi:UDP-N-acetylmuramate dehydrogenase
MKLDLFLHPDVNIAIKVDLTNYSTLRLKSIGNLAIVKSLDGLVKLLDFTRHEQIPTQCLGWGANTLFLEDMSHCLLIKLDLPFLENDTFGEAHDTYDIPASVGLNLLIKHAKLLGLMGWEVLTGIPASLGGAIFMNAGTKYGDISSIIDSIEILGIDGALRTIKVRDYASQYFAYRENLFLSKGEVIVSAKLFHHGINIPEVNQRIDEYLDYRKRTQPLATKNCGCVFKNPIPEQAGKLIDELGLKGFEMGALRISPVHANFIENRGGATYKDFDSLVSYIKEQIFSKKGIKLDLEVQRPPE